MFHSHSIYVQSVLKNFIYQVYDYVRNYHRILRRNASKTFQIKWLLQHNGKYYIAKLTVFVLIKVLFEYFSAQELSAWKNSKVRNDTEWKWSFCVALTVAVVCVFLPLSPIHITKRSLSSLRYGIRCPVYSSERNRFFT